MTSGIVVVEIDSPRIGDYFALFDSAFTDNPDWAGCYCAFYDAPPGQPFSPDEDAAQHRVDRAARLRAGDARGLLAYDDSAPIGWCNVSPRSHLPNLRSFTAAIEDPADDPAVIMCFVIHPGHRGQGVASSLLLGAVEAARRWGSPWLEAYPRNAEADPGGLPWTSASYKGPLSMYLSAGFEIHRDMGDWYVVRHPLRPT